MRSIVGTDAHVEARASPVSGFGRDTHMTIPASGTLDCGAGMVVVTGLRETLEVRVALLHTMILQSWAFLYRITPSCPALFQELEPGSMIIVD